MEDFERNGYLIVKNAITQDVCNLLYLQCKTTEQTSCYNEDVNVNSCYFSDRQVDNCYACYAPIFSESLLQYMLPLIETNTNISLYPSYSYFRIYYKDSVLQPHIDRLSCEYSATVCIKNNVEPWDIWIESKEGNKICVKLCEGDMLIYKGNELKHWREKYEGEEQVQIFLHYVDKNGPHKHFKYDQRKMLGIEKNPKNMVV